MGKVAIFNPVNNRIIDVKNSVNTPSFVGRNDVIINPTMPQGVILKYLKHENGSVVEMTQAEKDQVDQEEATANLNKVRGLAKGNVDDFTDYGVIIRALAIITMNEINILRAQHSLPARTLAQLKTAMKNEIDSGSAD